MRFAIQGLGEIPNPVKLVLEEEKLDKSYVIASDYQLDYVCERWDFEKPNKEVIKEAAERTKTELIINFYRQEVTIREGGDENLPKFPQVSSLKRETPYDSWG